MRIFRLVLAAALLDPSAALAQMPEDPRKRAKPATATMVPLEPVSFGDLLAQSGSATASPAPAAPAAPDPSATVVAMPGGGSSSMLPAFPGAPTEERVQLDKITTLNTIKQQEFLQKVRAVTEERDEAVIKNGVLGERLRAEMLPVEHEQRKLQLRGQIEDEKHNQTLAQLRYQRDRVRLENEIARERLATDAVKLDAEKLRFDQEKLKRDIQVAEMDFQSRKLQLEAELADHKTVALKADLELRGKKEDWKKQANREPEYLKEPFKDGVLTISDRRVTIDGPIVYGTADYVTERIHYFNNKSEEHPIFIVIDRSPGGSVMEGYRILKAMQASKAPVHVVVKSYAASMAATIATLAPRSYAYPNAVILHHQVWSVIGGNPTQQKQQLDILKEWDRRLREPIAKKMGTSMDKFTAKMYEHNVDGDWEEFAEQAVSLRWIDKIVHEIRETGILKEPDDKLEDKPAMAMGLREEADAHGERFVRLPRLQHADAYFLYNRDGYYR